ncbi:MAG: hypothetical protein ACXWPS_01365 [Ktedonobacteraceae bacterium]
MKNSDSSRRKFPNRLQFVIAAAILLLACIIAAIPLALNYSAHKQQSGIRTTSTPNMVTTITLQKVPTTAATATLAPTSEIRKIEISILDNIQQNGWDHASSINGGLGGLWINWRYGTSPLQVDYNGTASPDQASGAPLRHDPLTDIRYFHNLWLYKSQNPKDIRYDSEIAKYTAIIKVEWANAHDAQRGWLYDEEFSDLYHLSHDSFYLQQMQNLASAYARSINTTAGIFFKTSSAHPGGYYRPADALETGLALIQAGTQFHNSSWVQLGQNEVNFVYQHAYIPQYHTFPIVMDQVLNSAGQVNASQSFYIDNYRNYVVYGNQILVADIGQVVISLLDTYHITNNRDYLQKAFDLLSPFTASNNLLQLWDPVHLGYFEDDKLTGTTPQNPGTIEVANGKKDGGRMMEMLWAFHLADQFGGNYQTMENALLNIALNKVYYAPGHGVIYEMRPDWSLVTIKGIPEDWVTTEAMGIELESLFALEY